MEEAVTNKNDKLINRPKTSKYNKNIQDSENNTLKNQKNENLIYQTYELNNGIFNGEVDPIEPLQVQKENLKNIYLIEKDINSLYKWEHLFNNFRPLKCYTTIKKEKKENKIDKEENKNEEFKSPIILVDLPESQMNLFFGKNNNTDNHDNSKNKKMKYKTKSNEKRRSSYSNNNIHSNNINNNHNKISYNIRPMSMYSPRVQSSCYYFSSVFSDYYNEDFKSFCNKMPILKAKLKINPLKLKKEIEEHDISSSKKEMILNKLREEKDINLDKLDLIIAGKRRNPIPLLKSIFKQKYPSTEVAKENPKMYYNTMKPYGNDYGNVNYQQNDRWKLSNEIIKMRNQIKKINENENDIINSDNYQYIGYKKKKRKLILSYYDENDPSISIFKQKFDDMKMLNKINSNKIFYNKNKNEKVYYVF